MADDTGLPLNNEVNWRIDFKEFVENRLSDKIAFDKFGEWNNQGLNDKAQGTLPDVSLFFTYSDIGEAKEYASQVNVKMHAIRPIIFSVYISFKSFNDEAQNRAYDYAHQVVSALNGQYIDLLMSPIQTLDEVEDTNYAGLYTYKVSFKTEIHERTYDVDNPATNYNPLTDVNPWPPTGRLLKPKFSVDIKK